MNVSVNQRCVILVILAMIFVLALLKGVMQSAEVDKLSSTEIQFTGSQPNLVKAKPTSPQVDKASNTLVLINSASAEEIAENLDGIGEAIANRIIAQRQKQGPFQNFEQLKAVSGVGIAKIEANKQRISFD